VAIGAVGFSALTWLSIPHIAAVALIAAAVTPGPDDRDACNAAVKRYRKVKVEVLAAVQIFAECVAQPRISSCTVEFDEVEVLQDRLETAAADYRDACP
jgi:hypothetical protein